jgi:molecular chaperone DnaK
MVEDAEKNAAADKEKSEQVEIKNQAEALCYQTKKQLEQLEATCTPEEKQKIENLVAELEGATQKEDYATMKELMEQLNKAIMEVGEKAYKDAGQQGAAGDDAIETDFSAEK